MGLTAAPVNGWPLAWVAVIPLWATVLKPGPGSWQAAALWGFAYHAGVLVWILHLHPLTWMGIPWLISLAIAIACWLAVTGWGVVMVLLWWRLMTGLITRLGLRSQLSPALILALGTALWCSLETLWSYSPLHWTSLAFSQSPHNLPLLHLGQLGGPALGSAGVMVVNALLALVLLGRLPLRLGVGSAIALLLLLHGIGGALALRPLGDTAPQAFQAGIIQGNIPTREKLTPSGIRQAFERYTDGYNALVDAGADVVLTPEGALPVLWRGQLAANNRLSQAVAQRQVPLWLGTFAIADPSPQSTTPPPHHPTYINQSLITLTTDGIAPGRYNKVILVPLGEYIPFEPLLGQLVGRLTSLENTMLPGDRHQQFVSPFGPAAVGICYESAFSQLFRQQIADGGEFILTASNNDPYPPAMMAQHHAQDIMRAIETDRWALRATNTGISGLVDPHGHTHWLSQPYEFSYHLSTLYRRTSRTLYVRWGNWFVWVLLLGSFGATGWHYWRRS
jgi:apolipoprotein N-acyltransferase